MCLTGRQAESRKRPTFDRIEASVGAEVASQSLIGSSTDLEMPKLWLRVAVLEGLWWSETNTSHPWFRHQWEQKVRKHKTKSQITQGHVLQN